jgi:hypothetical protein
VIVVDISINRVKHISSIGAVRINPKTDVDNNTICTYKVGRIYDGKIKREIGTVEHMYGDGAEVLAGKIVAMVSSSPTSAFEEDNLERLLKIAEASGN